MSASLPKGFKLPKSLAVCADMLYETRAKRLAVQKEVDALQAVESALREHLIANLPKSEATGVSGKVANAKIITDKLPRVTDWEAVHAYIKKTGAFELMQKRLSNEAVQERWDAGKKIPGVEEYQVVKVSLTKVA